MLSYMSYVEESIVTPVAEAMDTPGSEASAESFPSVQTPLPSKPKEEEQTPEPEEPWYMTESISEGLVLGRAEITVNEEKSAVERENDIWNIDAMDEIDTAITYETTGMIVCVYIYLICNLSSLCKILARNWSKSIRDFDLSFDITTTVMIFCLTHCLKV